MSDSSDPDTSSDERGHGVVSPTQAPNPNRQNSLSPFNEAETANNSNVVPSNNNGATNNLTGSAKRLFRNGGTGFTDDETSVDSALCHDTVFKTKATGPSADPVSIARAHAMKQHQLRQQQQQVQQSSLSPQQQKKTTVEKMLEECPLTPSTSASDPNKVQTHKPRGNHHNHRNEQSKTMIDDDDDGFEGDRDRDSDHYRQDKELLPRSISKSRSKDFTDHHQRNTTHIQQNSSTHSNGGTRDGTHSHTHTHRRTISHSRSRSPPTHTHIQNTLPHTHPRAAQTSDLSESELTPLEIEKSRHRSKEEIELEQQSERLREKEQVLLQELRRIQEKTALEEQEQEALERERSKRLLREKEKEKESKKDKERERELRELVKREEERILQLEAEKERLLRKQQQRQQDRVKEKEIDLFLAERSGLHGKKVHILDGTHRSSSREKAREKRSTSRGGEREKDYAQYRQSHSRLVDEILMNGHTDSTTDYDYEVMNGMTSSSSHRHHHHHHKSHHRVGHREGEREREDMSKLTSTTTNKLIENQVLGYRLAEEIRLLRNDLLKEKQSKRMLLVQCDSLQDSMNVCEGKLHTMESQYQLLSHEKKKLEKLNEVQELKIRTLEASNTKLQQELDHYQQLYHEEQSAHFLLKKESEEYKQEKVYSQEYITGLELALKEMTAQSLLHEKLLEEEKKRSHKLESMIETCRYKNIHCIQELENVIDIKSMELTPALSTMLMMIESSNANAGVNTSASVLLNTSIGSKEGVNNVSSSGMNDSNNNMSVKSIHNVFDVYDKWEFLLQATKLKLAMMEKKLHKSKSHVSKLMNVVRLYEEIIPAANHLAENYFDS